METRAAAVVLLTAVVCALAPPAVGGGANGFQRARREHQRALRALQSGQLDRASRGFHKALRYLPSFAPSSMGLGRIALQQGRPEEALVSFERARDDYDELGGMLASWQVERYQAAQLEIQDLRLTVRQLQTATPGTSARDRDLREQSARRMESRIAELEAITLPDQNGPTGVPAEVYFSIGNALFQLHRVDEAVAAWERSVERNPSFSLAHSNLAWGYFHLRDLDRARAAAERAERLGFAVKPALKAAIRRAVAARAISHGGITVIYESEDDGDGDGSSPQPVRASNP